MNNRTRILNLPNEDYTSRQLAEDLLAFMTDEQVAIYLEQLGLDTEPPVEKFSQKAGWK